MEQKIMHHPMVRLICLVAVALSIACASPPERYLGAEVSLGNGTVTSYAAFDASDVPQAIGIAFSAAAFDNLPAEPSDMNHCFDTDGNGAMDPMTECSPWHERVIPLPSKASRRSDLPFKWALLNWNAQGHIPPGVYDPPHFDVHFYIAPIEDIFALERGTCGLEALRCDQFALASKLPPGDYMHRDFIDFGAAAPAMGNHLIDTTVAEFRGEPFTRAWIYGVYDAEVIFYEEMVALDYLQSQPDGCAPIKTPGAVALSGYYPTVSCVRYDATREEYTVSLEAFEFREAT